MTPHVNTPAPVPGWPPGGSVNNSISFFCGNNDTCFQDLFDEYNFKITNCFLWMSQLLNPKKVKQHVFTSFKSLNIRNNNCDACLSKHSQYRKSAELYAFNRKITTCKSLRVDVYTHLLQTSSMISKGLSGAQTFTCVFNHYSTNKQKTLSLSLNVPLLEW